MIQVQGFYPSLAVLMGVSHNTANSSPALTRLGAAVGKSATAGIGATAGASDFDSMPIYKDIKLCNLAANGTVNAYLGDAGFKRDGTNGDVMVEIPVFWYKVISGTLEEWWIASGPSNGFAKHPAFSRGAPYNDLSKIYVSAYEAAAGYTSKTGVTPLVSISRTTARSGAAGKGSGWLQLDIATVMAVNLLMYIEYATLDMQTAVAPGIINGSKKNVGGSDSMAWHTGRAEGDANTTAVKWRHIENWWGNVWSFVDGLNINSGAYYWCLLPQNFADNTSTNYTYAGYSAPTNLSASYIKTMGLSTINPWFRMPIAGGGSQSTYYCDVVHTGADWRGAYHGGTYGFVWHCGPAAWILWDLSSFSAVNAGCRLVYLR